jgi:pyruvate dehydrogenase E2 component (dihydrolipoamide acetyltransferase)
MPTNILMPALSPTMTEGKLAKWLKQEGDKVSAGDVLAEIETDKATMEVEAVDEGYLAKIVVPDGTDGVPVNAVIGILTEEKGEKVEAAVSGEAAQPAAATPEESAPPEAPPPAPPPVRESGPESQQGERIFASPLARRMAEQAGIDLASLKGSGPHGRIVKADIEAATGRAPAAQPQPQAPAAAVPAPAAIAAPHRKIPNSTMRKVIARRLLESKQTVPHFYIVGHFEIDALLKLRADLNARSPKDGPNAYKLSVNDLLIKALAAALTAVPDANVSFTGDAIRHYRRADISVAVAIPGGLITPVVRDAAAKSISAVAAEMKALSARAREGKLQPPDYTGGTASLSNLGMYGIRQFEAVINPPEGMILAVGAVQRRPWVADDRLTVATVLSATGSFDHRAIDGAVGAELMQAFQNAVEHPLALIA